MTEDELLAQIQETDSGAYIRDINGQRVLVTSSLESNTIVYVNPANMHIIHMDPIEWDIQPGEPGDDALAVKITGELRGD